MVFNAIFNNISVKSWRSVLLLEDTGVPGENQQPVASRYLKCEYSIRQCVYIIRESMVAEFSSRDIDIYEYSIY